jgi:hypothetical protein
VESWQPLSVRTGARELDEPYEGVPGHLRGSLLSWVRTAVDDSLGFNEGLLNEVVMRTRAPVINTYSPQEMLDDLLVHCNNDQDVCLDIIDGCLRFTHYQLGHADDLRRLLADGGSVWTVSANGRSLQRAVEPQAQEAYEAASSPADTASDELVEAWSNAYGRVPDASDAWDHAIKAVEAILIPIVVPRQDKPTLGHVVSHLGSQGGLWKILLPGPNDDYSVEPLVAMLRLLWPNPDRHGSPQHRRLPTLQEARAVIHLAVTIVQWGRDGQILKK